MMSCGKPVIATVYSAHTEFCNENNSLLIDIDSLETASDGKWFKGDLGEWASLEGNPFDSLVGHFRTVYASWKEGVVENPAGIQTAIAFSWDQTAKKIKEAMYEG